MPRVLAFAGSARRESLNKKLVSTAAEKARDLGADVSLVDLADYPMPLYDGDFESEHGLPEATVELRKLMLDHNAFLISCPEYNGSITPLLKNTIDWTSRPADGIGLAQLYRGKVAALLSASPGGFGGMRGLVHVRAILSGMGTLVVPGDFSLGSAHKVLTDSSSLADEKLDQRLATTVGNLVRWAS